MERGKIPPMGECVGGGVEGNKPLFDFLETLELSFGVKG